MKYELPPHVKSLIWAGLYVLVSLIPLIVLITAEGPSKVGFWWDFSIALGVGATTLVFLMSVLTARFELISGPFGIDIVYYFHRQMSYVIVTLVVVHPIVLFLTEPLLVYELQQPVSGVMLSGLIAAGAILAQVVTSVGRCWFNIEYDTWRRLHIIFAITALGSILIHMILVNYYTGTFLQSVLWSLFAATWLISFIYVRVIRPASLLRKPYVIESIENIGNKTWNLNLIPRNHSGIRFQSGQFAWITINHSPFALKEHPFSFSSSANDQRLSFSVKELGDFTSSIKFQEPGQEVYVDGAYGVFSYERYPAAGYVFIAGGIGVAPMMSMLRTMADRGITQNLLLFYGSRSEESAIFTEDLEHLKSRLNLKVVYVFSHPGKRWNGERGIIDDELLRKYISQQHQRYQYFICGPGIMTRCVERSLRDIGIAYKRIHSEVFNLV